MDVVDEVCYRGGGLLGDEVGGLFEEVGEFLHGLICVKRVSSEMNVAKPLFSN